MKKRKLRFDRVIFLLIIIVFIILGITLIGKGLGKKKTKKVEEKKIIENINEFGYSLEENEGEYYNEQFNELKSILNSDTIDEEKYASTIAKLFIIDFFTLDNKISKADIGGVQFVYNDYRNDFEKYAKDSIYKSVKNNIYGDRKQDLPIVKNVEINNITNDNYYYLDKEDDNAFFITAKIEYITDLGYQTNVDLVIIHSGQKLEIVKMN